jgi:hypothetical protein
MQHIASTQGKDTDDLAFSFNLLLNSLISAGLDESDDDAPATYLAVCNLLDALAYCRDTDPAWEQAAHDCAAQARQQFGAAWLARTEGDDPDPFQRELNDWVTTELKHAGKHHFWEH